MISLSNFFKLLVFVVFIIGDACVHWYIYSSGPSVKGRCTSDYPELSVRLAAPEVLKDGAVIDESDDEVYSPGAWWRKEEEVWGCPCSRSKPCLRKCCGIDEIWKLNDDGGLDCVKSNVSGDFLKSLIVYEERHAPSKYVEFKISSDSFYIFSRDCEGSIYRKESTPPVLLSDGSAWDKKKQFSWDQSDFCMESVEDYGSEVMFHMCHGSLGKYKRYEYMVLVMSASAQVVSSVLVLFSLLVYSMVPRIRRGPGKAVMCYLVSELIRKIIFGLYLFPSIYMPCLIDSGPVRVFTALSLRAWLMVVSYQMYSVVSPVSCKLQTHKQFLMQCGLAWGVPLAMAILSVVADTTPAVPDVLKPKFGGEKCYFQNEVADALFVVIPSVIATLATMSFCAGTLLRLRASRKTARTLKGPENRRHNSHEIQWSCLYVKVCLIVKCLNYLINIILALLSRVMFVPPAVLLTSEDILAVRGVEVFLIFICQKEVILDFLRRLTCKRK